MVADVFCCLIMGYMPVPSNKTNKQLTNMFCLVLFFFVVFCLAGPGLFVLIVEVEGFLFNMCFSWLLLLLALSINVACEFTHMKQMIGLFL
jgi:hypothetical protein